MYQFKKPAMLVLALLLLLSFAACGGGEPAARPAETPPAEEPIDCEPIDEEDEDNGYEIPLPPTEEDLDDFDDTDWSVYPVIINGVGVPGASLEMVGEDEIFPTHVSLMAIERALDVDVFWNMQTNEVSFPGLNGFISFVVGSADFTVAGETITLEQESLRIDDEIYLPIPFFRDVFGADSAYFSGGHVFIDFEDGDMQ